MKRLILFFLIASFTFSCSKDADSAEIDFSEFLADDNVRIVATLNNSSMEWVYGEGFGKGFGGCIWTETDFVFNKSGMSRSGNTTNPDRFRLYTPEYHFYTEAQIDAVFNPGQKAFGSLYEGFFFKMTLNGIDYESQSTAEGYSKIEVLKRSEMIPYGGGEHFIVWFHIENLELISETDSTDKITFQDALIALQFEFFN